MPSPANDKPSHRRFLGKSSLGLLALAAGSPAMAAAGTRGGSWEAVIITIVLLFTLASAALPLASLKQWSGPWRLAAAVPLGVLGAWVLIIALARQQGGNAHGLWPLEIFAWAMLNLVYMVVLFTGKRILAKADRES